MTTSLCFKERVAVVVGGSSGIGLAVSRELTIAGASIFAVARDRGRLVWATQSLGKSAHAIVGDISSKARCKDIAEKIAKKTGTVDYLIVSSGFFARASLSDVSENHWNKTLNTNLKGPLFLTQALLPLLVAGTGKSIIFISSSLAHVGASGCLAYCASKGGLSSLVRAMAIDLAPLGIRVNAVSPGHVDTPMISDLLKKTGAREEIASSYPLGRIGTPEDVAGIVAFLLSDRAKWITGLDYKIDGGRSARG